MTQLTRNGLRLTVSENLTFTRGDTRDYTFPHDVAAAEISVAVFTVRTADGDATVVIQIASDEATTQWDVATDNTATVEFLAADTVGLDADTYNYDIELTLVSGEVYTPRHGTLALNADVTYDSADAQYLTWDTRADLELEITQMMACVNATQVTTDAASGAGAIVVDNAALFTAAETILVTLDDGTYEEHDIASISSSTLTLDATTLGDDVASGNIVVKKG